MFKGEFTGYPVEMRIEKPDSITMEAGDVFDIGCMKLNTPESVLLDNVRSSIRRQLPQLAPYPNNPQHVALVGGGWSLRDTYEDLKALYHDGVKLIAMNGSGRWLMERNLRPSMFVILDGRPENAAFVRDPIPGCKYFVASQCAPEVFDALEGRDVTLFHGTGEKSDPENVVLDEFYGVNRWVRVPPAGMVGITSIMLLRILGFHYQHLFGIDGCYDPVTMAHHGFEQTLNDSETPVLFRLAGREFWCTPALAASIVNFINVVKINGDAFSLEVYGDGALAHVLKFGATAEDFQPAGE